MRIGILTRLPNYYTERRIQEEAEARSHEVIMLRASDCDIEIDSESERPKIIHKGKLVERLDAVIPRIAYSNLSYSSAILRQFESAGTYTPVKSLAVGRSHDILRTLQLLSKGGVGVPKTIITHAPGQVDALLERVGLPVIIKAASARNNDAVLVETHKAASSVLKAFYMNDADLLLQEYVGKGEGAQATRAIVVGSMVVASVKRGGNAQTFFSQSGKMEYELVAKLTEAQNRAAVKAAKAMGLSICAVDMIVSPSKEYVLRVDASPDLENIELITKRNVAVKIIEYIEKNAKQRNRKDKVGA